MKTMGSVSLVGTHKGRVTVMLLKIRVTVNRVRGLGDSPV